MPRVKISDRFRMFYNSLPAHLRVIQETAALRRILTRTSSGDEIANVNFLYDDIVHAVKIQ